MRSPSMRSRSLVFVLAAGSAHGQEGGTEQKPAVELKPAAAETEGPRPLLMEGFDALGASASLRALRLDVNGWLEQSYSANTHQPKNHANTLHAFDDRSNAYRFNQLVVAAQRTLAEGNGFDVGGSVELLYGSDGRLIHAAGLRPGD